MNEQARTNQELLEENALLKQRIQKLERSDAKRKRTEKVLQQSEAKFRALAENSAAAIFLIQDTKYVYTNPAFEKITGYTMDDLSDMSFWDFLHPDFQELVRNRGLSRLKGEEPPSSYDIKFITKSGHERWAYFTATLVELNNKPSIIGSTFDITERKRAESELHWFNDLLRAIIEAAPTAIIGLDLDGNVHTVWNQSAEKMLGWSAEEVMGRPLPSVQTEGQEEFRGFRERIRRGMTLDGVEVRRQRKDGTFIDYSIYASPLHDPEDKIVGNIAVLVDITERKAAQEVIRQERDFSEFAINAMPGIFYIFDENGKFLRWNGNLEKVSEYTAAEIAKQTPFDHIREDYKELVAERMREVFSQGQAEVEAVLVSKTGKETPYNFYGHRVFLDGKPCLIGMGVDITDRKRAKEALQQSEAKFRALAESSPSAIFLIQDNKYIYTNPAFEKIIGYTMDDLADMNFWDFTHPDFLDLVRDRGLNRLKGESVASRYEIKFIAKNGQVKWVDYSASLIDFEGKPTILGSTYDITERKQAEENIHRVTTFLDSIVENIPDMIFVKDAKELRFVRFNRAGEELLGYSRDDLLGKSDYDFFPKEQADFFTENDQNVLRGGKIVDVPEEPIQTRNRGERALHTKKVPILDEKGEPEYLLGISEDITDRKQVEEEKRSLEERLQRAEKMEALGILAGGVAHDLNNVLGVVVGYAELLLNRVDESSTIRPGLLNIMKGGEKAAAIVEDLLTLARRGVSGRQVLNLNIIVTDCQQSTEFENLCLCHPSVRIKTDLDPDLLNISGSSVHLGKTLLNLISNAVEAMPNDGGVLTIKTFNQYLDKPIQGYDEVKEGDYVVLSVSDTGEGISVSDLKRIFEPFYTKKVMGRSGTGLGLAVVWGTVKDHHGYINVESAERVGSTFTLYFPVTREEISAKAIAVSSSEYIGRGESILIVDDVEGQRDLAAEMLRKLNYNITSVSSGEDAVEYLKERQVDLVILDMIMDPGMDGLDTYRSILKIHPEQKAIIVSGFSETRRVNVAQSLGAGAYVKKPYIIEKLGLAVRKELDRK